jgi:ribosomal protein S18 acetylase RimI-like enzyme
MIEATNSDKNTVVDILAQSFKDNKSVNYIVKQDVLRMQHIRQLMDYSFDVCKSFGRVVLSEDKKACALIVYPDKKRTTVKSIVLDLKLITKCIGISGLRKAMSRESKIKKLQPKERLYYLWFIGVHPVEQHKGVGSFLLNEIIEDAKAQNRLLCLETSTQKNIPWYEKFGFKIYNELDFGYKLFFLKR